MKKVESGRKRGWFEQGSGFAVNLKKERHFEPFVGGELDAP